MATGRSTPCADYFLEAGFSCQAAVVREGHILLAAVVLRRWLVVLGTCFTLQLSLALDELFKAVEIASTYDARAWLEVHVLDSSAEAWGHGVGGMAAARCGGWLSAGQEVR